MSDLTVFIPARNEEFLNITVANVLEAAEMDTEVIVICDGAWPLEPLADHPKVTIIQHSEAIGQRQSCNLAARVAASKYIMKLDAHCKLAPGFDRVLIENHQDNWVQVPRMYNLHMFDWVCASGHRRYQGPSGPCAECNLPTEKEMVYEPRWSRESDFMKFDRDLRFGYWGAFKERPEAQGDLAPTMSLLGACWFLTKEYYWELDGMDERHGSWGQMGTEIACKTWLYGGALMVNKKTWFAHMFRTQGGDFSFPYELKGSQVEQARKHSREMWTKNQWPKAKHDLQWLLDKFSPIPGWEDTRPTKPKKAAIYYTDNRLNDLGEVVREQILVGIKAKHIVSVSLAPLSFGRNYVLDLQPSYLTMFKQILHGLQQLSSDEEIVFFLEHDVLYHPKHFDFIPPRNDVFYYNTNVWRVRQEDGFCYRTNDTKQVSGLVAYKSLLLEHYTKRIELIEQYLSERPGISGDDYNYRQFIRKMGFEPGTVRRPERVDYYTAASYEAQYPNLDIRHNNNLTPNRWTQDEFVNQQYTEGWKESNVKHLPGWEHYANHRIFG